MLRKGIFMIDFQMRPKRKAYIKFSKYQKYEIFTSKSVKTWPMRTFLFGFPVRPGEWQKEQLI